MKPAMQVVLMRKQTQLLNGSSTQTVTHVTSRSQGLEDDVELDYVGQGDYEAR